MKEITVGGNVSKSNVAELYGLVNSAEAFVQSKYPDVSFDDTSYEFQWNTDEKYQAGSRCIYHRVDSIKDKHTISKEIVYSLAHYAEQQMDRCCNVVEEYCGEKLYDSPRAWHSYHNQWLQDWADKQYD